MVNIENMVITELKQQLLTAYPNLKLSRPYDVSTEKHITLPLVTIECSDNAEDNDTFDGVENYSSMTFELEVYTDGNNRKELNNRITLDIDRIMSNYFGMKRTACSPLPNVANNNVYRKVMLYDCLVNNQTLKIYRR